MKVLRAYEHMTYEQLHPILTHTSHIQILDKNGDVARVKITSVKTWKRKPDILVSCKFGLYEYFSITIVPGEVTEFVQEIKENNP